jgi:hypothetical protein
MVTWAQVLWEEGLPETLQGTGYLIMPVYPSVPLVTIWRAVSNPDVGSLFFVLETGPLPTSTVLC